VYKAWVNTVNASGGINGHPIQLNFQEDSANPGTGVTVTQALISAHVDAIVDMSQIDSAFMGAIQAANIPVVGYNATNEPFFTNPDFYPEGQTGDSGVTAYIQTIKAAGGTDFGVMYCVEAPACSQYEQALKVAGQKSGIPLTYTTSISATAPNFSAPCIAAQQKHIKDLIVEDATSIIARVATDCDRQGYDPTYVIGGGSYGSLFETTPGLKKSSWSYYPNLPYWLKTPAVQAMNTAVDKYYPGVRQNASIWSGTSPLAWPAGLLLEDAVKAGGLGPSDTPSAAEIIKGLQSLKGDTLDGWSPPLTFAAGKPHPVNCWFTGRVIDGVPQLVNNGQLTCGGATSP
jgi:branched-chain amino acid transport system substrate-binding protein